MGDGQAGKRDREYGLGGALREDLRFRRVGDQVHECNIEDVALGTAAED